MSGAGKKSDTEGYVYLSSQHPGEQSRSSLQSQSYTSIAQGYGSTAQYPSSSSSSSMQLSSSVPQTYQAPPESPRLTSSSSVGSIHNEAVAGLPHRPSRFPGSINPAFPVVPQSALKAQPYREVLDGDADGDNSSVGSLEDRGGKDRKRRRCSWVIPFIFVFGGLFFLISLSLTVYGGFFQAPFAHVGVIEIPEHCSEEGDFALVTEVAVYNPNWLNSITVQDGTLDVYLTSGVQQCMDVCVYPFPSGIATTSSFSVGALSQQSSWVSTEWSFDAFDQSDQVLSLIASNRFIIKIRGNVVVKQSFLSITSAVTKKQGWGVSTQNSSPPPSSVALSRLLLRSRNQFLFTNITANPCPCLNSTLTPG
eukprot:ANDGO_05527.mRNA.1 hypothetical protein